MSETPQEQARTYILIVTVENRLVAPTVLADARQRLDDAQAELLALLVCVDGDVLDVADAAEPAEELALHKERADTDDTVRLLVDDDDGEVRPRHGAHGVELRGPGCRTGVVDDGED